MGISRNLSKQPLSTCSGRITLKNSLRDYFHLLKSLGFRLLFLKCGGSYSLSWKRKKSFESLSSEFRNVGK